MRGDNALRGIGLDFNRMEPAALSWDFPSVRIGNCLVILPYRGCINIKLNAGVDPCTIGNTCLNRNPFAGWNRSPILWVCNEDYYCAVKYRRNGFISVHHNLAPFAVDLMAEHLAA